MPVNLMPRCQSSWRVVLMWLRRAVAFRAWWYWISAAAASKSWTEPRPLSHQARTTAATAIWTWQTVNSGFFSRQFLPHPRQKQVTDRAQKQVPLQPHITPTLIMIQPDFPFIVFKAALDPPTRKRYQQQLLH